VTVTPDVAASLPLRAKSGVGVVSATNRAFDSETGGLEPGDIIHAVNGQWIVDVPGLRTVIDAGKPGDSMVLQIERRGALSYIAFTID
jgi:S1-C subfamily serine protease